MKYVLILLSIPLVFSIILPTYLKLIAHKKNGISLFVKVSGTLMAVLFGIAGTIEGPNFISIVILSGLVFGLLGDIFLEIYILLGGVAFFIGNILYIYAMVSVEPLRILHIFIFLIFIGFFVYSFGKDFKNYGRYRMFLIPYVCIVAFMAALSIPFILLQGTKGMLFGFGTFLFAVSDYLLAYRILYKTNPEFHKVSLGTYYFAQLLIGISIFLHM